MDVAQGRAHKMIRFASSHLLILSNYYSSHIAPPYYMRVILP